MTCQFRRQFIRAMLSAGGVLLSGAAFAHHSFAMFDSSRTVTIHGTLYAVEFVNPHSWIWIKVTTDTGEAQTWGLEGGSPEQLRKLGYTKQTLKVGHQVTATLHPLKDGRTGGQLLSIDFGGEKEN